MKKFISLVMSLMLVFISTSYAFAKSTNDIAKPSNDFSSLTLVDTKNYKYVDGTEIVEYYYKPSSKVKVQALSITPMAMLPEEGDFKIVISKGTVVGQDWFNSVSGYLLYLQTDGVYNAVNIAVGFVSKPVAGLISSTALTLLHDGLKGKGLAYSTKRTVVKWGQIYHNGSWVDYYRGTQDEVFWGQQFYVYAADGTQVHYEDKNYNEANGFKPIYVNATSAFRDNNKVYQLALTQYKGNYYWYRDTGSVVVKTSEWLNGVSYNY